MSLEEILELFYDLEINVAITSLQDNGWTVTLNYGQDSADSENFHSIEDVLAYLINNYPDLQ